jgi:predicted protein tyrosine phosphatase
VGERVQAVKDEAAENLQAEKEKAVASEQAVKDEAAENLYAEKEKAVASEQAVKDEAAENLQAEKEKAVASEQAVKDEAAENLYAEKEKAVASEQAVRDEAEQRVQQEKLQVAKNLFNLEHTNKMLLGVQNTHISNTQQWERALEEQRVLSQCEVKEAEHAHAELRNQLEQARQLVTAHMTNENSLLKLQLKTSDCSSMLPLLRRVGRYKGQP